MNEAVERAHVQGALTHASLMVAGPAVADAVARARRLPGLRVGLHLVAVEGPSVLPHAEIPALVDARGWFPFDQLRLGLRYTFAPAVRRQLAREIEAQFAAFAATGLSLSHADAHKHMHLHPYVGRMLVGIGARYGLQRVRVPSEPPAIMTRLGAPAGWSAYAIHAWTRLLRHQVEAAGMSAPDAVFGLAWSGHMTRGRVSALLDLLQSRGLPRDVELYFHPAAWLDPLLAGLMPDYEHQAELQALLDAKLRPAGSLAPTGSVRPYRS